MLSPRRFLPLLLLIPAGATAEETCRTGIVETSETGIIRLADGTLFLPNEPEDAYEILPGDTVFVCPNQIQESETLFPIHGRLLSPDT